MDQADGELSNTITTSERSKFSPACENSCGPLASDAVPTPSRFAEKEEAIRRACDLHDFDALVSYAISEGGFLRDDIRRLAWPILLQCDSRNRDTLATWNELPQHSDEDQIQLDVSRSFVYYPSATEKELAVKKDELSRVMKQVLRNYPMLCYFQGYHDIIQVLLLVLGEYGAVSAAVDVSLFRIRDYMLPSLIPAVRHLQLIPAIIERVDPMLRHHLSKAQPFFALAATLTLYAHDVQEYNDIARLFDFLLAREPVVALYLFAAVTLSRKKELLDIPVDEPEMIHFVLSKLPYPLNLDGLILETERLVHDYPPESLPFRAWHNISEHSVLKTSRSPFNSHKMEKALELLERQIHDLEREERRKRVFQLIWKHRRMISSTIMVLFAGAISIWIRKRGFDTPIWSYINNLRATSIRNTFFDDII